MSFIWPLKHWESDNIMSTTHRTHAYLRTYSILDFKFNTSISNGTTVSVVPCHISALTFISALTVETSNWYAGCDAVNTELAAVNSRVL